MNRTIMPSPTATRNLDEFITASLIDREADNDIGPFENIDEALIAFAPHDVKLACAKRRAGR